MKKVIVCRVDGLVDVVDLAADRDWRWYAKQIGAEFVESVHPKGLKEPYMFLCDEEGLLKGKPVINFLGSWLYQTQDHGDPIVGDIMIVKEVSTPEGRDFDGLEAGEAEVMAEWLLSKFREAYEAILTKVGHKLVEGA